MNKLVRITMMVALAGLLLAAGVQTASPESVAVAQPVASPQAVPENRPLPGREPAGLYAVQPGTAAGGAYQLNSAAWSVRGTSSVSRATAAGRGYRLETVGAVRGTGTPCCCTYMPCILNAVH